LQPVIILLGLLLIALGAGFVSNYRGLADWGSRGRWSREPGAQPLWVTRVAGVGFFASGVVCLVHGIPRVL
jgi:hypothetical protein